MAHLFTVPPTSSANNQFLDLDFCTGTHDNETMEGWWVDSAAEKDKNYIKEYLGLTDVQDISWIMMREAFKSISQTSIVMMQVVVLRPSRPAQKC